MPKIIISNLSPASVTFSVFLLSSDSRKLISGVGVLAKLLLLVLIRLHISCPTNSWEIVTILIPYPNPFDLFPLFLLIKIPNPSLLVIPKVLSSKSLYIILFHKYLIIVLSWPSNGNS